MRSSAGSQPSKPPSSRTACCCNPSPTPTEEHREIKRVKTSHTFFQKDAVPRGLVPPPFLLQPVSSQGRLKKKKKKKRKKKEKTNPKPTQPFSRVISANRRRGRQRQLKRIDPIASICCRSSSLLPATLRVPKPPPPPPSLALHPPASERPSWVPRGRQSTFQRLQRSSFRKLGKRGEEAHCPVFQTPSQRDETRFSPPQGKRGRGAGRAAHTEGGGSCWTLLLHGKRCESFPGCPPPGFAMGKQHQEIWGGGVGGGSEGRNPAGQKTWFPKQQQSEAGTITRSHRLPPQGRGKRRDGNAEGNGNRRRKRESLPKSGRRGGNKEGVPPGDGGSSQPQAPPHTHTPCHRGGHSIRASLASAPHPAAVPNAGVGGADPAPPRPSR
ncbi:uncharacterized protein LOC129734255 [Falco cherrug]|uniref:uncharacterized protein LOC129734255 n=1 Tax=Falco cherrug TaxID=345164 RepID=UPI002478AED5|nr:uncharacterized protein LOC129734255 [Falco cherrug]